MMMMMMTTLGGMVIGLKSIDNGVYRSLHIPLISSTRQDILGNIVKEVLNGVTRIVGWGLTTLVRSRKKGEGISKKMENYKQIYANTNTKPVKHWQ